MSYRAVDIGARDVATSPDQSMPVLGWLAIDDLVVDEDYQRPLTQLAWRQINKIAEAFDWAFFLPVLVAPAALEGKYSIIDGQHRTHAAKLAGFLRVPAQIVDLDEVGQARAFAAVNGIVTAVTPGHIYRAGLRAGETWALATQAAVVNAGVRLIPYRPSSLKAVPGDVSCVAFISGHVRSGRGAVVTLMLDAIKRSRAGRKDVYPWSRPFLHPFMTALLAVPRAQRRDLAKFLDTWPPAEIERQVMRLKRESPDPSIRARTGSSLMAEVISARLSKWVEDGGGA
jgi:hypothetical protein